MHPPKRTHAQTDGQPKNIMLLALSTGRTGHKNKSQVIVNMDWKHKVGVQRESRCSTCRLWHFSAHILLIHQFVGCKKHGALCHITCAVQSRQFFCDGVQ